MAGSSAQASQGTWRRAGDNVQVEINAVSRRIKMTLPDIPEVVHPYVRDGWLLLACLLAAEPAEARRVTSLGLGGVVWASFARQARRRGDNQGPGLSVDWR